MNALGRTWPALFAWGAGLLHIALGASIAVGRPQWPALLVMGALMAQGAGELAWGAVSLRAGRAVAPRTAAVAAVAGTLLAAAAIAVGCSPLAAAAAIALDVAGAAIAGRRRLRRRTAGRPWTAVVGMATGALLVAGLVTPALSTTDGAAQMTHTPTGGHGPHAGH